MQEEVTQKTIAFGHTASHAPCQRHGGCGEDCRFEAYESLQEAGLAVDRQNYDLIYTAPLDGKTTLEDIYRTFNLDRPADFTGHSLSVSDVVVLNRSGKEEAHYCDSFGFTPVPEFFLQREKQLIFASAPLMSSMSCAYTVPVLLIRRAI